MPLRLPRLARSHRLRRRRHKDATGIDLPAVPLPQTKYLAIDVSYGIEVDDISKGINDVIALSDRHGGQIYERTINITDDRSSTASFVIKLPPEQIEQAIADLDAIGIRRTASQGTEDVTGQAVDIDARLVTAQASLDRVRKLLESATDLGQILSLESQLTERETLVEQYTAMKRAISDRVSLATLRVQLTLSPEPVGDNRGRERQAGREAIDRQGIQEWMERLREGARGNPDLHRLHRAVPRNPDCRGHGADTDQPPPSLHGATKSINCSTAPTNSGSQISKRPNTIPWARPAIYTVSSSTAPAPASISIPASVIA